MWSFGVPNVPCGVESISMASSLVRTQCVPNVPCGVERWRSLRVGPPQLRVPNVPCGVESGLVLSFERDSSVEFLMYRVELKDFTPNADNISSIVRFLMYRVELKVYSFQVPTQAT